MSISELFSYFAYAPVARGFLALTAAGVSFPLIGVFVLRLNLVPLRFALMHGALLGGAAALASGIDPLAAGIAVDLALVFVISPLSRRSGLRESHVSTLFMVLTVGLAFAVVYKADVPAQDAFSIFWGSLYALTRLDLALVASFSVLIAGFVAVQFRRITAVLYSREIAFTSGVPERALTNAIMALTGVTVAFGMKLIGALLLDSILLLPAIAATFFARSVKGLFVIASAAGLVSAAIGFFVSLAFDLPASSAVTVVSALLLCAGILLRRLHSHER